MAAAVATVSFSVVELVLVCIRDHTNRMIDFAVSSSVAFLGRLFITHIIIIFRLHVLSARKKKTHKT